MDLQFAYSIIILIFSVVLHEVAHGYAAYWMGDSTPLYQGRLTLNPFRHLEWFGSFILPVLTYLAGGFIIGWAKPVQVNPYDFRFKKYGEALVALAGPATNIAIALIFGAVFRYSAGLGLPAAAQEIALLIVAINVVLAVFNMMPIPPLDGSKVLFSLLPLHLRHIRDSLERYALPLAIGFLILVWPVLMPVVSRIVLFIVGL
jgi:Zn-dependent protease